MNINLTTALAVLAGVVLLALVVHGAWSTRRAGPRQAQADPLAARREPGLGEPPPAVAPGAPPGAPTSSAAGGAPDAMFGPGQPAAFGSGFAAADPPGFAPEVDGTAMATGSAPAGEMPGEPGSYDEADRLASSADPLPFAPPPFARPAPTARRAARIDALIDVIVPLSLDAPISAEFALQHLPASRRVGNKFLQVEGLSIDGGDWEPLQPGARYSALQAAVQLANRRGPLNEIEFSEFVQMVERYAESLSALSDFPDMLEVVARARELDQFASQHDAQLTARLRANSVAWSVGYIQQCAARHGFVPGAVPGRLVMAAAEDAAPPVLVLAYDPQAALADDPTNAAVRDLSLSLDVPQTPASAEPFAAWQLSARSLADDLDAALIDDQEAPITLHAFTAIHGELQRLYASLAQHDLAAGSAAARRLFA